MLIRKKWYFCSNQITVDMKKINFLLALAVLLVFAASCSQSSKTQKSNVEAQEQPTIESDATPGSEETKGNADMSPGSRMAKQLDQVGSSLTEEQRMQLEEIAGKYDMSKATTQEERRAMRDQLQNEMNSILTPEQRAKLDEKKKARKAESGN
jgi:Spy/CpxP family protein refolding chaperone